MNAFQRIVIAIILFAAGLNQTTGAAEKDGSEVSEGEKLFALHVRNLFREKCIACHGKDADDLAGSFDMRSRKAILAGGESFGDEVITAGHGETSVLYRVVARTEDGYEMPPKDSEALTETEAWAIRDWITAGAPWPDDERVAAIESKYAEGVLVSTSGGLDDSWTDRRYEPEKLWAYRALQTSEVPNGVHPVDWFIDDQLANLELPPAPAADPRVLARRLSYGLTGLPPNPDAVATFIKAFNKNAGDAVAAFADRLMATPQYGEHFARHWLDVTRYADTAGFANDYTRPNAWRYRDYVIRSFADDKPYPEFVRQQIAGDEIHSGEIDSSDPENLIATGFLRMGPWEQTGMSVFQVTRGQWLDDVTDSVGQTFLAHPLQCAKCHDHKFDPIPTRDYYSMMAVFSTTQFAEPNAPFMDCENQTGFVDAVRLTEAKISGYQDDQRELNKRINAAKKQENGEAQTGDNGLSPGDEASLARIQKNIKRHQWELDRVRPIAFSVYTGKTIARNNVQARILKPEDPWKKGYFKDDVIHSGGDIFSKGDLVKPGAISAAALMSDLDDYAFESEPSKRRLALADWIVDERNPLTARVIVNRVWSWHFGQGIAGNPNNFGGTGELPTHPMLLDFLSTWFIDHGWSIKSLSQLIVSSKAYQRTWQHPNPEALAEKDPNGKGYAAWQPRRLSAEEIRDSMLFCSGELNDQVGGIPARPDVNMEVAMQPRQIMGGTASVYEPDPLPRQRNRRSLYAEKIRGLRDPFLETFNQPGSDNSCERRDTSIVATQALTLIHSAEVNDRSLALANRILKSANNNDDAAITTLFQIVMQRDPTTLEMAACLNRWSDATKEEESLSPIPKTIAADIVRTVMAEKTGQPYDFVEHMPAYQEYVADLGRDEVDARTRGLSHVCLVLFNSNEFLSVD